MSGGISGKGSSDDDSRGHGGNFFISNHRMERQLTTAVGRASHLSGETFVKCHVGLMIPEGGVLYAVGTETVGCLPSDVSRRSGPVKRVGGEFLASKTTEQFPPWEFKRRLAFHPQALVGRLKENLEKMHEERNQRVAAENREKEQNKRMQRQMRDMKEEMGELSKKEGEASRKKHELVSVSLQWGPGSGLDWPASCSVNCEPPPLHQEMDIESLEAANQSLQVDLKLAFKRIGDLQAAIEDEMESDDNDDLINRYHRVFLLSLYFFHTPSLGPGVAVSSRLATFSI